MSSTLIDEKQESVTAARAAIVEQFRSDLDEPSFLAESRAEAWNEFQVSPAPSRSDETWRFSNLTALAPDQFVPAPGLSKGDGDALVERSLGLEQVAGRFIFANNSLVGSKELEAELTAKGVIFTTLERAAREHESLFRKHFMTQAAALGGARYAALHRAHVTGGTFLYVPKNVEIALPLEVFHWVAGKDVAVFPHTLIVAGENSKVTLIDHFQSSGSERSFACGVNDLYAGPGSKLTYVCVQDWSPTTAAIQINATHVDRDALASSLLVNLGSAYSRWESVSRLAGSGSRSDMLSVSHAVQKQEFDQRTLQVHEAPNASSDLLYKNALDDQARTIFSGLIQVVPGAHKTDAYQKVRNLLLSDEAEANSAPGLEIEADDVRCTHGTTSGELEPEELFYLLSRGIPEKEAQRLIVAGFLQEAVSRLGNEAIESFVEARIAAKVTA